MTLTRGARITGSILSAVLALIAAGWIVRDLRAVGGPGRLWDFWSGVPEGYPGALPATTGGTLVLLLVQLVTAFAVPRSSVAAAALVSTGVTTLLLRLPGVWTIGASWTDGRYPDELRTRALICTFVTLAASLAMIVTAAAGRRPAQDVGLPAPTWPRQGASVVAFFALSASGAVLIAWEIRQLYVYPDTLYPDWYLGGAAVGVNLVDAPPGWSTVTVALIALFAAFGALTQTGYARSFGMIAAAFLLLSGGTSIARAFRMELVEDFPDLSLEGQLAMLSWAFLAIAGLVALIATARRGVPALDGGPGQGWGPGSPGYGYSLPGVPGPAPGRGYPYPTPPGQAPGQAPGYGHPHSGQGFGQDPAGGTGPGYGYPQGPPAPPTSPPPNW